MKLNDKQLGIPSTMFTGTTAEIAALSAVEGMIAYDTTLDKVVYYDSAEWVEVGSGGASGELTSIGARVTHDTTQSVANTGFTTLAFNTEKFDTDTIHDTSTNNSRLTCKTTGKYLISANITFAANATGYRQLVFLLNGTTYIASVINQAPTTGGATGSMLISTIYSLTENDYVEVQAAQSSGGALNVLSGSEYTPIFSMQKLGSDIVFQANADIGARVYNDASISIPNTTLTVLTFNSERWDTDSIHDTSTNPSRLTCKTAGKYLISAHARMDESKNANMRIRLNGTTDLAIEMWGAEAASATSDYNYMSISTIYDLSVNDYVEVYIYHSTGSASTISAAGNYTPEFMMQKIDTENLLDTNAFHTNIVNEIGGLDEKETIVADDLLVIEDSEASGAKKAISIGTLFASDQAKCVKVRHASDQNLANDTTVTLAFDTEDYDTDTMHDTSTNNSRITCKTAGKYHIHASVTINKTPLNLQFTLYLNNTTSIAEVYRKYVKQSGYCTINISTDYELDVDDYIEVKIKQDYGETLSALGNRDWTPIFEVFKI